MPRRRLVLFVTAAALLGASGAVLDLPRTTLTVLAAALGALVVVFDLARWRHRDAGAWQRQIDREFRLRIAGTTISVLRNEAVQVEFEWRDVVEIQSLSRRGTFPPLFWKVVTATGEYFVPDGGRYARQLEQQFIYALPGYHEQAVVTVPAPAGYDRATSMWRKDDPYPKRELSEVDW